MDVKETKAGKSKESKKAGKPKPPEPEPRALPRSYESNASKTERRAARVEVVHPWRALSIGHYEVPLRLDARMSTIPGAGLGCFAEQHIPGPDFLIGFYGGPRARLLPEHEFRNMPSAEQQKCLPIQYFGTTIYVWPETTQNKVKHPTFLVNHRASIDAKDANELTNVRITPEGAVVSTRPIAVGEELFANYGLLYWVDFLIMNKVRQSNDITEMDFEQIYKEGFPIRSAEIIWDAIDNFYCNMEPGFESKEGRHKPTVALFNFVMDYIVDTYIVGLSPRTTLGKMGVLGIKRYAKIKWSTSVTQLNADFAFTLPRKIIDQVVKQARAISKRSGGTDKVDPEPSGSAAEQTMTESARVVDSEGEYDAQLEAMMMGLPSGESRPEFQPAPRTRQHFLDDEPEYGLPAAVERNLLAFTKEDRRRTLVREAFRVDIERYFFEKHGYGEAEARRLMIDYKWHGIPGYTYREVFQIAHDANRHTRDILFSRMNDVWTDNDPLKRPHSGDVHTLRSVAPDILMNLLNEGRGTAAGTRPTDIHLFPFMLNLQPADGGVPGAARTSAAEPSSAARQAEAEQQEEKLRDHLESDFATSLGSGATERIPAASQSLFAVPDPPENRRSRGYVSMIDDPDWDDRVARTMAHMRDPANQREIEKRIRASLGPISDDIAEEVDDEEYEEVLLEEEAATPAEIRVAERKEEEEEENKRRARAAAPVPLTGPEAAKAVRAFAPADTLKALGAPRRRPANAHELVKNALKDWRFKLYKPVA